MQTFSEFLHFHSAVQCRITERHLGRPNAQNARKPRIFHHTPPLFAVCEPAVQLIYEPEGQSLRCNTMKEKVCQYASVALPNTTQMFSMFYDLLRFSGRAQPFSPLLPVVILLNTKCQTIHSNLLLSFHRLN